MNGADLLCDTLLANDVDVCFSNPGTSEMHFVAALDRKPQLRCVLGLFEGVVTGAADGYARMANKPAVTLLHTGPGLANALANMHNARRARTPMINVPGDHASWHLEADAPLTSDIDGLAWPMSHWVGRATSPEDVGPKTEEAWTQAMATRGPVTLILPADSAWGEVEARTPSKLPMPVPPAIDEGPVAAAAAALKSGKRCALFLQHRALREGALEWAGRIALATGADLFHPQSDRAQRGAGRVAARMTPYNVDMAIQALAHVEVAICIGAKKPVVFFGYPGKPSSPLPDEAEVIQVAEHEHDLEDALRQLAEAIGLTAKSPFKANAFVQNEIAEPTGTLTPATIAAAVARRLPENAIIVEESVTSAGPLAALSPGLHPHDHLPLTGGAIGEGIPLAVGAGVACPDRKIVAMQADGSGMYTVQGLWTQAREELDVVTIVYANRAYAILQGEMRNVGVNDFGENAKRMLDLDRPDLDWVLMAKGMGVDAGRAETIEEFTKLLDHAMKTKGPFLIEARI
ncbi:acetolactate synthase large subunit [Albimonas sp. CAU 1670]|uniref:acetolactate synthase large subunit n=1 Tax=Albimonas sp. CAU 1670 TaxID=3032599 RepID=UPI0023DBD8B4|nr:acetolactate synthase large subunit [Albimonas sp. CAU 1670]MDF2231468.1 acetolactate synthase large subunit [Albimonas sp. CAU 1670]